MRRETLRNEWVRCGKRSCRSCPHGPYWYAYWREDGKVRKRYIGKGDPRNPGEKKQEEPADWRDSIFDDRRATVQTAMAILGIWVRDMERIKARYRELCRELHPDRNPAADPREFLRVQAAYQYLAKTLS